MEIFLSKDWSKPEDVNDTQENMQLLKFSDKVTPVSADGLNQLLQTNEPFLL